MKRRDALVALGCGVASLAGCVADVPGRSSGGADATTPSGNGIAPVEGAWPTYQFDASRTGHDPTAGTRHADRDGSWTVPLAATNTPTVDDGTVYVGSADDAVLALDAATGERQWRFPIAPGFEDDTPWSTATIDGGTVYVRTTTTVYALDAASGDERWHAGLDGERRSRTVAVGEDALYVQRDRRRVVALDADDGEPRWTYEAGSEPSSRLRSLLAVADGTIYLATFGGVHAVDAASGERVWRHRIEGYGRVYDVAVADGTVFLTSSVVRALDAATGERTWAFDTESRSTQSRSSLASVLPIGRAAASGGPGASPPAIADGTLYAKTDDGEVVALDAATGDAEWVADVGGSLHAPVVVDDTVYVSGEAAVHALDASSGDPTGWRFTPAANVSSAPVVVDGVVFLLSRGVEADENALYALTGSEDSR